MKQKTEVTEEVEQKKVRKARYVLAEVATQVQPIIVDNDTEQQLDLYAAVSQLLNDVAELKRGILS